MSAGALPLLAVPAGDLDATYIGTTAIVPIGGDQVLCGGISDVQSVAAGDHIHVGQACRVSLEPLVLVWVRGYLVFCGPTDLVMTDASPAALAAMDSPA